MRCLDGRSISGFNSTVIELCSSPYPHFHLSYPSVLDRVEVRQSERVAVAIPVTVHTATGGSVAAEMRDLSASGALLIEVADADRLFLLGFVYEHLSSARGSYSAQSERDPNAA